MLPQTTPTEMKSAITPETTTVSVWRARMSAFLRIVFGIIWGIDAWLKWQPDFNKSFTDLVTGAQKGQAPQVQSWIGFWGHLVSSNPHFFAYFTAWMETGLARLS